MDLTNVFGANVEQEFFRWFNGEYAQELTERYPDMKGLTLVIIDPSKTLEACLNWHDPLEYMILIAHFGDEEASLGDGGTRENVERKLRFVLRTGEDSVYAEETSIHLVLPGDFPWQGAGVRKDFVGGVSGLAKEEDWRVFTECADKLTELLTKVNAAARAKWLELREGGDDSVETKYLTGDAIDLSDFFSTEESVEEESSPA